MELSPFWHPSHSILPCLHNCVKNSPLQTIPQEVISNFVIFIKQRIQYNPGTWCPSFHKSKVHVPASTHGQQSRGRRPFRRASFPAHRGERSWSPAPSHLSPCTGTHTHNATLLHTHNATLLHTHAHTQCHITPHTQCHITPHTHTHTQCHITPHTRTHTMPHYSTHTLMNGNSN